MRSRSQVNRQTTGVTGPENPVSQSPGEKKSDTGMSLSMHDGVEVWCDCCSCEAEPYWLAAFEKDTDARED